jgi:hypothetical protein
MLGASAQSAESPPSSPGGAASLPSCVSADWIHFGRDGHSAVLDDGDRRAVIAEMHSLYPVIEHDGLPVTRVALWRQRGGAVLYVAAIDNPRQPGEACFIATVSAARFSVTAPLLRKYLLQAAAP